MNEDPRERQQDRRFWLIGVGGTLLAILVALPGLISAGAESRPTAPRAIELESLPDPEEATRISVAAVTADPPRPISDRELIPRALAAEVSKGTAPSEPSGFDCMIEPSDRVQIGSSETAVLQEVYFDRSDLVKAGEVVARLESEVEEASVQLARLRAEMSSEVSAAEVSAELGERRKERAGELFEGKALSLDLREEVETEARLAKLELQEAQERKQLASLQLRKTQADLDQRHIKSPIDGVVVERLKSVGEVVKEEGILEIAKIDPLHVEVILPAAMFGEIVPGMKAEVMPEAPADGVYIAQVGVVDRVIDPASGTFGARLELPNPDQAVPSGLHCQVSFLENE